METRLSYKFLNFISARKSINFNIDNNNDENGAANIGNSNSNDNYDNPGILHSYINIQLFSTSKKALHTDIKLFTK